MEILKIRVNRFLRDDFEILAWLKQKNQFNNFLPRLNSKRESEKNAAYSEVVAAFYLENYCDCKVTEWHPSNRRNGQKGDFCIRNQNNTDIFCEVKSPGWQSEIEDIKRLKIKQKWLRGEFRWTTPNRTMVKSIVKVLNEKKLLVNGHNLLIFNDDLTKSPVSMYSSDRFPNFLEDEKIRECKDFLSLSGLLFLFQERDNSGKIFVNVRYNKNSALNQEKS